MSLHARRKKLYGVADAAACKARFRRHCHLLLMIGYKCVRANDNSEAHEDTITQNLVVAIKQVQKDETGPHWIKRYFVHDQGPVSSPNTPPPERPKIDIEMESNARGRPLFHFEAKRLRTDDSHSVSNYVGPPGLGGFLDGSYAPNSDAGGMLGYVQSATPDHWQQRISEKLSAKRDTHKLTRESGWSKQSMADGPPHLYLTRHVRDTSEIAIYHAFLDFRVS